jgi:hypothetical protein
MKRIVLLLNFAILLSACSGSSRVEGIIPGWANTSPPRPAAQYVTRNQPSETSKPLAQSGSGSIQHPEPQEAKKTEVQNFSEVQRSSEE